MILNSQNAQLVAAIMSAFAALAAAVATWRGPMAAAKLAEQLRQRSETQTESRRFKTNVFAVVMQERAALNSADGVRALNSIDVAFADCVTVREAWAELYQAYNSKPLPPPHVLEERARKLLKEMATNLGLAEKLRLDDFGRIYFPDSLQKERQIQYLQREVALKQLLGQSEPAANVNSDAVSLWPPPPEQSDHTHP